jgi:hypothetical protein
MCFLFYIASPGSKSFKVSHNFVSNVLANATQYKYFNSNSHYQMKTTSDIEQHNVGYTHRLINKERDRHT